MEKIKSCPFCGKFALMGKTLEGGGIRPRVTSFFIYCTNKKGCMVYIKTRRYLNKNDAITAWNKRDVGKYKKLAKAGNDFIKTFIPHDKGSECFRAYKNLEQTLKEEGLKP